MAYYRHLVLSYFQLSLFKKSIREQRHRTDSWESVLVCVSSVRPVSLCAVTAHKEQCFFILNFSIHLGLVEPKNTSQHSKTKNEKILGRASCWTFHMFARASCKVKHITEASFKLLLLRRQVKQQISHTEHLERTTTIFFCKPQKKKKNSLWTRAYSKMNLLACYKKK